MLEVVCWKWRPHRAYRTRFPASAVNVLRSMVERHLLVPHRFSCITDDPVGIDPRVRVVPIWDDFATVPNPSSLQGPSCYRRLRMFSAEARELIGERILSIDLDVVITGDLSPLVKHDEDFVIWGGQAAQPGVAKPYNWYNGSLMYLRAGARRQVWERFTGAGSALAAHRAGCRGSDQGWIAYCLGPREKTWGEADGVYSYRNHVLERRGLLSDNARVVAFHGVHNPWDAAVRVRHKWVRDFYR